MYQTIDDDGLFDEEETASSRYWLWGIVALFVAVLALIGVAFLTQPHGGTNVTSANSEAERRAYLTALAEPSPALRRARLTDFINTYPGSDRSDAINAQLSVLEASEASDWARVTDALYDGQTNRAGRLAALEDYEARWGANLLGGRAEDVRALRDVLTVDEEADTPSRRLEEDTSPIPPSIQSGSMAGGPTIAPNPAPIIPVRPLPVPPAQREVEDIPPRIIRAPTPRYPRGAQRRGIPAVVVLEMDVGPDGRVDDVRIISVDARRYGKQFAREAERAAERTRFKARTIDGRQVATRGVVKRYRFKP